MAIIVQKFGGTSVGSIEKIKNVARKVKARADQGNKMVVVLSAMAGVTDKLIALAKEVSPEPDAREMDVLLATGEQQSVALFCIAARQMGLPAHSLLGFQAAILTDNVFGKARIKDVEAQRISEMLDQGQVVVVAGFQGLDWDSGDVTTLGRGGSDTTAVALAAAIKADVCEIFTDVDGVYTTDPNIVPQARKLAAISYDEMLEMASLGAKVLEIRSVAFAKQFGVKIHVRSTFTDQEGTMVVSEEQITEKLVVSGVAYNKNEARITIKGVVDQPGVASKVFTPIGAANIVVDVIIQNTSEDGKTDISFTVPKTDYDQAMRVVQATAKELGAKQVIGDPNVAKVSIIGTGMRNHAGVATKMFQVLAGEGINIETINTSEIKISCVIKEKYTELAVRALHEAFHLAGDAPKAEDLS
ncbi:aspartate kinase [Desulfarculus baarsii DSM 2075]|uniref:Aspartokinase n=1 Tax=Desulfarculus baarsii (strain ATCC 33931 / DSM 2075 / LMG 7858 / VKM B-1802 / 2st14) TaxID=644282 RepID=E1QFH8_DESB2|nr:aspartate kinase [Desulfarculus baarsii]ADK84314.1 aspartate kinase [Desulfarculus baarsii DSM 2075]